MLLFGEGESDAQREFVMIDDPNHAPRAAQIAGEEHSDASEPSHTRRERTSRSERFALYITNAGAFLPTAMMASR